MAKALKKDSPRAASWIEKNSDQLANWLDDLEGLSKLRNISAWSHKVSMLVVFKTSGLSTSSFGPAAFS